MKLEINKKNVEVIIEVVLEHIEWDCRMFSKAYVPKRADKLIKNKLETYIIKEMRKNVGGEI